MKILSLKVQNFRTFGDEGVSLSMSNPTTLIGENNTGKSNILQALDLFFNFSRTKMSKGCFHHDDLSKEITIEINFGELTDTEKKKFNVHLDEKRESLTVTQKIKVKLEQGQQITDIAEEDYDFEESKHGTRFDSTLEWASLGTKPPTKANIKKWWKEQLTIDGFGFKDLFDDQGDPPEPEIYQENLNKLWDEHFDIVPKKKVTGDEKMLGWKNKLKGNLPKFFYVSAIKNIEDDLKVLKTNPFGEIISWLTQNISEEIRTDFEEKSHVIIEEALSKIDQDDAGQSKMGLINQLLNKNLAVSLDCKLELKFGKPSISDVVFPSPRLYADDGYYSEVNMKGNGFQRLCILSLLRTYNELKRTTDEKDKRNMIVGIEEPEIYLHPPVKRATYRLLRSLSAGNDQVIYSTHDSYFVDVEHFDEIRLFRKVNGGKPKALVYEVTIDRLIDFYKQHYGKEVKGQSLRHRFGHICDETKNEGFFAKKVILIEGLTEKYSLPIYFLHKGFDLDNERIAMIWAGSADNISYLYVTFNEFHIPCYIIWDGDRPETDPDALEGDERDNVMKKSDRNRELLEFVGEKVDESSKFCFPETAVTAKYAIWERDFEETFHKQVGKYDELKAEATKLYGTKSKPLAGRFVADSLTAKYPEAISPYVDKLIDKIKECCWQQSCLA